AGVTVRDPGLMALAADVVRALRWRGPCEIEALRDAAGRFWLVEVNPRFPAWVDLTAGAGRNLPLMAVRLAAGEPVDADLGYAVGAAFVRISTNLQVNIADLAPMSTLGEVFHTDSSDSDSDSKASNA
ncbi:MAG: ATP-grasp domain-containing protein, partial [Myxococcales bacterium]|nr:ATP-grasp domain-containing protein [Myxococcales bacterium]